VRKIWTYILLIILVLFITGCTTDPLIKECTETCICGSDSGYYQHQCKESCEFTKSIGGEKDLLSLIETNKQNCELK
jgi:hypothetical protein